jgi:hypothetical protein
MGEGITDEQIVRWNNAIKNGQTITQIAKAEQRAYKVVAWAIRNYGQRQFRQLTTAEREHIQALYREGQSISQITQYEKDKSGACLGTIWRCVKKIAHNKRQTSITQFIKRIEQLTDRQRGYLAGIIDGEGCININKEKNRSTTRYRCSIAISNCDPTIIYWIKDTLLMNSHKNNIHVGKVRYHTRETHPKWSPTYEWRVSDKNLLRPLCEMLIQYSIGKQAELQQIIDFIDASSDNERQNTMKRLRDIKATKNTKVIRVD